MTNHYVLYVISNNMKQILTIAFLITLSVALLSLPVNDIYAATVGAHVTKINTDFTEPGEAAVSFEVCSGNNQIVFPQIMVFSDKESKIITLDRDVEPNTCHGGTTILKADSLSSITATLVTETPDIAIDDETLHLESARLAISGMSNDGQVLVEVTSTMPQENMPLDMTIRFTDELDNPIKHVNYDLSVIQEGIVVFEETKLHTHTGNSILSTDVLYSDSSVDLNITLQGIGLPDEEINWTGPTNEIITFKVVPEFGTIAMMILVIAIISVVVVTTKSRLSLRV